MVMQIIFSREAAEVLKDRYTVLELETFDVEDKKLETFCVVPGDKISIGELPNLETYKNMHQELIEQLKENNTKFCLDAIQALYGKFGGELDSFYDIIRTRLLEQDISIK
jgi:hypothetical protein